MFDVLKSCRIRLAKLFIRAFYGLSTRDELNLLDIFEIYVR